MLGLDLDLGGLLRKTTAPKNIQKKVTHFEDGLLSRHTIVWRDTEERCWIVSFSRRSNHFSVYKAELDGMKVPGYVALACKGLYEYVSRVCDNLFIGHNLEDACFYAWEESPQAMEATDSIHEMQNDLRDEV